MKNFVENYFEVMKLPKIKILQGFGNFEVSDFKIVISDTVSMKRMNVFNRNLNI